MNYFYKIRKSRYSDSLIVAEYLNGIKTRVWDLNDFFSNPTIYDKLENINFKKAKKWLIENHPEFFI